MAPLRLVLPPPVIRRADLDTTVPNPQAASDATDLERLIAEAIRTGEPLRLGRTFTLHRNLAPVIMAGDVRLELSGRIKVLPGVTTPLQFICPHSAPVDITAVTIENFSIPVGTPTGTTKATKITAPGHGCVRGDIIKIVAEEAIPGGSSSFRRVGEFQYVQWVSGDNLWFSGRLQDTYSTGRRLVIMDRAPVLRINDLTIFSDPGRTDPCGYLTVRGFHRPRVQAEFRNGTSYGLWLSSCHSAVADVAVHNMLNTVDTDDSISGYGVQDQSSFSRVSVSATDCRHAYTTVSIMVDPGGEEWKYGRPRGNLLHDSTAQGCSSAAYDVHSEAIDCTIANITTGNTRIGEDASGAGVELRGRGCRVLGSLDRFSNAGAQFHATTAGGCQDGELVDWSYWGAGDACRANSSINRIERARALRGQWRCNNARHALVENADIRFDGVLFQPWGSTAGIAGVLLAGDGDVVLEDCTFDFSNWTGTGFRVVAFEAASTGNKVTVRRPRFRNVGASQLACIVDAASCAGTVIIEGVDIGVIPDSGDIINGGSLTAIANDRASSTPTWTAPAGSYVRHLTPAASGYAGWVRTAAGAWKTTGAISA